VGALRPVAAALIGRADVISLADLLEHRVLVYGNEPFLVDALDEVLFDGGLRPQELAGGRVKTPRDASLAGDAGQRLAAPAHRIRIHRQHDRARWIDERVDDHHLKGAFLIPVVARKDLMLPDYFAGPGPNGEARVRASHGCARHLALSLRSRADAARSVVHEVKLRIVGELAPDSSHPTALERRTGPGLVSRRAWTRDHLIAPELLAGLGLVAGNVATVASYLACATRDDHAVCHDRAARVADKEIAPAIGLP